MAKDYIFGFNPTKVPESFERPVHIPEFIHGPRPNIVPSQDNKVISYYEEIIRLKRAMDELQSELEAIIRSQIPDYDSTNANDVLSVNEDGTKMEWKPATSASGVSASVEQTETGATITITDASGTTTANVENGEPGDPGFSPSASVQQTETGATITVTDKSGTTTANINNGGKGDPGFSPSASVQQTETGATITVTDKSGTTTANLTNGAPGHIGQTPSVTATATVNDSQGTPSVEVTKTGTDEAPAFNFAFSGLKGETGEGTKGDPGFSPSASVQQTVSGATITITDASGTTTASVDNGTDGITPNVSATATADNTTGTPSVNVTKSGTNEAPAFNFAFSGIKGETGEGTKGDDGFSPIANVQQTNTGATITVTDKSGTTTASVKNGTKGDPGVTPSITATATVDNTIGTPSVNVTKSGTDEAPSFEFAFTGIKGSDGQSIEGPAGQGVPTGGTAGQVLTKKSGTDYDTEWKNPSGGGAVKSIKQQHLNFVTSTDTITLDAGAKTSLSAETNINYGSTFDFYITANFKNNMYKDGNVSNICPFVITSTNVYPSGNDKVAVALTILNVSNSSVTAHGLYGSKPSFECDLIIMKD